MSTIRFFIKIEFLTTKGIDHLLTKKDGDKTNFNYMKFKISIYFQCDFHFGPLFF